MSFCITYKDHRVISVYKNEEKPYLTIRATLNEHDYVCCEFSDVARDIHNQNWIERTDLLPKYETYLAAKVDVKQEK